MYPIGLSSCGKPLNEETFAAYARAGITAIEITPSADAHNTLPLAEIAGLAR